MYTCPQRSWLGYVCEGGFDVDLPMVIIFFKFVLAFACLIVKFGEKSVIACTGQSGESERKNTAWNFQMSEWAAVCQTLAVPSHLSLSSAMGKLNIAHHKSYHPYRRDNIERVRKDEEEARRKEENEDGRMMLAVSYHGKSCRPTWFKGSVL